MSKTRPAVQDDVQAITDIYNQAIATTNATFDTEAKTVEEQLAWFEEHGPDHPVLVAEAKGVVIGWAALSNYSTRCAYARTAEISIYIDEAHRGHGTGRQLLQATLDAAAGTALHTIIARITSDNELSIRLHREAGFETAGLLREVGFKFGKKLDVCIMQHLLNH